MQKYQNLNVCMYIYLCLFFCCAPQTLTHPCWQCTRPSVMCVAVTTRRRQCSCAAPSTPTLLHDLSGSVGTSSLSRARTTGWTSTSRFTLRYMWTHAQPDTLPGVPSLPTLFLLILSKACLTNQWILSLFAPLLFLVLKQNPFSLLSLLLISVCLFFKCYFCLISVHMNTNHFFCLIYCMSKNFNNQKYLTGTFCGWVNMWVGKCLNV